MARSHVPAESVSQRRRESRRRFVALLTLIVALALTESAAPTPAQAPVDVVLRVAAMPSGEVSLDPPGKDFFEEPLGVCRSDNPDGECPVTYSIEPGTSRTVTLEATPGPNQSFHRWSLPECATAPKCVVELSPGVEPPQVWALFTPAQFQLRITGEGRVRGANGLVDCVSPQPESTTECPEAKFDAGTPLTLTAEPPPGAKVTWAFGCDPGDDPHALTCVFRPENRYIGVRFGEGDLPAPPFNVFVDLRVSKAGSGTGTVAGSPAQGESWGKIDCGSTCTATPGVRFGTRVKLTAAHSPDSHFVRWEGAPCATETTCVLNAGPVTSVRAVFDANPSPRSDPAPAPQAQPASAAEAPPTSTAQSTSSTEEASSTAKRLKLQARLLGVTSRRIAGRYGVDVRLEVTKLVNARLRLTRNGSFLGQRLLLIRKARTTTWVALARSARPGTSMLLIRLRDRDGQVVTFRRRVDVGR